MLAQPVNFDPARWKERQPDPSMWPTELDACPQGRRWPYVDRRTVFDIASDADRPRGAIQTYVASAVWGTGTRARGVARRLRPLHQDRAAEVLADAARLARREGTLRAFERLHGDGNAVKGLGPSFGTKFLYFAGYGHATAPGPRPLILDQYVAAALRRLDALDLPSGGWSPTQYESYLAVAHAWADAWATDPDVVERVLFAIGKTEPLVVDVLAGVHAG